jgi:hypothetical protein
MKTTYAGNINGRLSQWRVERAFTLPNLLVSISLFMLLVVGFISLHLLGSRLLEISQYKLSASDTVSRAGNKLLNDLRSGKMIRIGQGTGTTFLEAGLNRPQQGNAVQIYPSTNTLVFIRYFLDPLDQQLKRMAEDKTVTALGGPITNTVVFTAEDSVGNILTNKENHQLIGVRLEFAGAQKSGTRVGPSGDFASYRLQTKIASRTLE